MPESLMEYFRGNQQERAVFNERDQLRARSNLNRRGRYRLQDLEEDAREISRRLFLRRIGAGVVMLGAGVTGVITALRYFSADSKQIAESTADTAFEQVNCDKVGVSIPKPRGWTVLEVPISQTFINCYISQQPITREEDFRSGLRVSKLAVSLAEQDKIAYARQLASRPETGVFPQANTFKETRVGSFRIFSGRFTSTRNNLLSDEERKIIVPDRSNFVYIAVFSAPKPSSDEDFRKYGKNMLDGIIINGLPTNHRSLSQIDK